MNGSPTTSIAASRLILSLGEVYFFFFRIYVQIKTLLALDMVKIKREKERENLLDRVRYIRTKDEEILDQIPTTDKSKGKC